MGLKVSGSITGPLILTPSDNPLTVTSTGSIASIGADLDGVDGAAGTDWIISNAGSISSDAAWGVNLAGSGVLDNSGTLTGLLGGYQTLGAGWVTNDGAISGTGEGSYGILLNAGGDVTNNKGGSISALAGIAVDVEGGFGAVTNAGAISGDGGVLLDAGGNVTNEQSGSITGSGPGRAGSRDQQWPRRGHEQRHHRRAVRRSRHLWQRGHPRHGRQRHQQRERRHRIRPP